MILSWPAIVLADRTRVLLAAQRLSNEAMQRKAKARAALSVPTLPPPHDTKCALQMMTAAKLLHDPCRLAHAASTPPPMSEEVKRRWEESQRKLAGDKAGFQATLHDFRKRWARENSAREAAKAVKEAEKWKHIAAAKAAREAKRAAQREERLQQLAALGAHEQAIKVSTGVRSNAAKPLKCTPCAVDV